jgi:uncharacterized protein (DUF2336 family)
MQSTREARERTIVGLAQGGAPDVIRRIVAHLRVSGEITPTLILRAALSGHLPFVQAVFAELTGLSTGRVSALLAQAGAGREALHDKAGLPRAVRPALLAVLSALHEPHEASTSAGLSRRLIALALGACQEQDSAAVLALLQRYDNEAARDEARQLVRSVVLDASLLELSHDDLAPGSGTAGEASPTEEILQVEFTEASEAA